MGEQDAGLGLAVGGVCHRKIGRGIDQGLAGDLWSVAVARGKCDHGGKIAAGAVAADRQPTSVDAELAGFAAIHFVAAIASSTAAGNLCSGARR